jgi:large subunit ribosomal protein L11
MDYIGENMAPKSKKVSGFVKLQVPAGKANPSPPIGTVLGPRGINIMEFCKTFNAQTQQVEQGTPIPVEITIYSDKTFTFIMKTPPNTFFLKKAAGIEKGSPNTGRGSFVGKLTIDQIREVAQKKMPDLNANDLDAACRMLIGSARSIGIQVEGEL